MDGNYIALIVSLIIWIGLFLFALRLDRRIRKLEDKVR